jgi:acetyltransferase-like isoleucine patch superfamily enzyme
MPGRLARTRPPRGAGSTANVAPVTERSTGRVVPYDSGVQRASTPPLTSTLEPLPEARQPAPMTRMPPGRLRGGPLALLRFASERGMLRRGYVPLILRWAWLKLRWRGRLRTDGLCFVCPGVKFEIGRNAIVSLGRWSWLGHGTKVRAHEGTVSIGAKSVLGQECTISAYQHVSIGRECIIADRVMMIDFDHGVVDVERPIRQQGIYKRDVRVGHNVWIGYGACLLRGVSVGNNCVIGTSSVVTGDLADDTVAVGIPARVIRQRAAPKTFRWAD